MIPSAVALPCVWKGDFDGMVARRFIRVLVPYSRSLYFNDKGRERGLTADFVRDFERYLNQKYTKQLGNRPFSVYMAPTTRDELLQDVADGFADAAAGNLTVTAERQKLVDFVAPTDQKPVSELVLTGRKSPAILEAIVVDDWKALMWPQILPQIKVNTQAVLRDGGLRGVAIRKDSPQLAAELTDFWVTFSEGQNLPRTRMAQYYKRIKQIQDPTGSAEWKRFEAMLALFRKYGERYAVAPLMLAAQGYQESELHQDKRSQVGAIGVAQLMPATGAERKRATAGSPNRTSTPAPSTWTS